mgnify:CR=1 FL=1
MAGGECGGWEWKNGWSRFCGEKIHDLDMEHGGWQSGDMADASSHVFK